MKKFPFWATILTVLSIIILCALGTWQVQRLHWKQGLLAEIDQAYQIDVGRSLIGSADLLAAVHENRLVLRGTVIGHYLGGKSFAVAPRPRDGQQGFHLYTPFKMLDGGIILVNRGWMPAGSALPLPPGGTLRVAGLIRKPDPANRFTPANDPVNESWFTVDVAQLAKIKKLPDLAPYVLYAEGRETGAPPVPVGQKPELYNNHKAYAVFWFMLAGLMVGIYVIRFRAQITGGAKARW